MKIKPKPLNKRVIETPTFAFTEDFILTEHKNDVLTLLYNLDNTHLLSLGKNEGILIWDTKTRQVIKKIDLQNKGNIERNTKLINIPNKCYFGYDKEGNFTLSQSDFSIEENPPLFNLVKKYPLIYSNFNGNVLFMLDESSGFAFKYDIERNMVKSDDGYVIKQKARDYKEIEPFIYTALAPMNNSSRFNVGTQNGYIIYY